MVDINPVVAWATDLASNSPTLPQFPSSEYRWRSFDSRNALYLDNEWYTQYAKRATLAKEAPELIWGARIIPHERRDTFVKYGRRKHQPSIDPYDNTTPLAGLPVTAVEPYKGDPFHPGYRPPHRIADDRYFIDPTFQTSKGSRHLEANIKDLEAKQEAKSKQVAKFSTPGLLLNALALSAGTSNPTGNATNALQLGRGHKKKTTQARMVKAKKQKGGKCGCHMAT